MNERDLRIGNWVYFEDTERTNQVGRLDLMEDCEPIINGCFQSLVSPIPLTPEILEACGFNATWYEDYCQYELLISDAIEIYNGDKNGICEAVFECCGTEIYRAKYLHQLQNLFYALTGTELEVKSLPDNIVRK